MNYYLHIKAQGLVALSRTPCIHSGHRRHLVLLPGHFRVAKIPNFAQRSCACHTLIGRGGRDRGTFHARPHSIPTLTDRDVHTSACL